MVAAGHAAPCCAIQSVRAPRASKGMQASATEGCCDDMTPGACGAEALLRHSMDWPSIEAKCADVMHASLRQDVATGSPDLRVTLEATLASSGTVPGVAEDWFDITLARLDASSAWHHKTSWVESTETFVDDTSMRHVCIVDGGSMMMTRLCVRKEMLSSLKVDIHSDLTKHDSVMGLFAWPGQAPMFRVAAFRKEAVAVEPDLGVVRPLKVRIKRHKAFTAAALKGDGAWSYHVTRVWTAANHAGAESLQRSSRGVCEVKIVWTPPDALLSQTPLVDVSEAVAGQLLVRLRSLLGLPPSNEGPRATGAARLASVSPLPTATQSILPSATGAGACSGCASQRVAQFVCGSPSTDA